MTGHIKTSGGFIVSKWWMARLYWQNCRPIPPSVFFFIFHRGVKGQMPLFLNRTHTTTTACSLQVAIKRQERTIIDEKRKGKEKKKGEISNCALFMGIPRARARQRLENKTRRYYSIQYTLISTHKKKERKKRKPHKNKRQNRPLTGQPTL